ncbi:DUF4189 domain-containing protein [Phyllobacterium sp. YR531]|uniref:DUF4189 domain-containing protein n=1 Tax=Phyllobacterium sp. YR531 TaxID=1144343 RepID=UPI00026FA102|nr:DUF4189 domain-containing protein [Phyllobacterium sp. YR531]EJN05957.1 hypothetical protein PMI41_00549 [Phyllobacterium sp. YR531]
MRFRFAMGVIGSLLLSTAYLAAADLIVPDVPVPDVEERGIWAAIAYSEADGVHGFFWGADKRQEATDLAIKHCENDGGKDCVVVEVFRNHRHWDDDDNTGFPYLHCGALAVAKEKTSKISNWSAKSALNRGEAEDAAISACEVGGTKCNIREWVCT